MTSVLIDTRSWLKFSFIAVFFSSIIFTAGFILGYKNATTYNQTLGESISSSVAKGSEVESESVEHVTSDILAENQNRVDGEISSVQSTTDIANVDSKNVVEESTGKSENVSPEPFVVAKTFEIESQADSNIISTEPENLSEIKFTIQAGLYGTLSSAESVAKKLKSDNYDAYVSEYVNKKNEINYNVRVGYFVDKQSALPTLYAFRREKKSDAYLVKFSADAMIIIVEDDSL